MSRQGIKTLFIYLFIHGKMEQEEREQPSFPKQIFISTLKQEILKEDTIDIPVASNSNVPVPSTSDVPSLSLTQPKSEVSEDVFINEPSLHQQVLIKEEELSSDDEVNSNERLGTNVDKETNLDAMDDEKVNIYQPICEFKGEEEKCQTEATMSNSVFLKEEYTESPSTEVQLPNDSGMEEMSFGNHFLAGCSEPQPPGSTENSGLDQNSELYNGPYGDGYVSYCGRGRYMFVQNDKANSNSLNGLSTMTELQPSKNMHDVTQSYNKQYCTLCSQPVYVRSLTEHIARVHSESILYCQYCSYKTPHKAVLRSHVIRRHSFGQKPIDCPYCKYVSLSILDVEYHIEKKHRKPKEYFHCNQCDYKNQGRGNLNYHIIAKHTTIKNYVCPHCDYKCIIFHNMKRHGLKVHNKRLREETCSLKNNLPVNTSVS